MPHYRRARVPGGAYFFTVVTERRRSVLIHADVRADLRETIVLMREALPFLSTRWRLTKRHVTPTCGPAYRRPDHLAERRAAKQCDNFWQHRFWEHLIRDEQDFCQHLD